MVVSVDGQLKLKVCKQLGKENLMEIFELGSTCFIQRGRGKIPP